MSVKLTEYVYSTLMIVALAVGLGGAASTVAGDAFSTVHNKISAAHVGSFE